MRSLKASVRCETGYALLAAVFVSAALLVSAAAAIQLARSELHFTADHVAHHQAFYVADAGVQSALTRLSYDRSSAGTSTTYTYTSSASLGGGTYSYTIDQDPLFPSDPERKRITSSGTRNGQQATVVANAVVQPGAGAGSSALCSSQILMSDGTTSATSLGRAQLYNSIAVAPALLGGRIFDGDIFSNRDAEISWAIAVASTAAGNVKAYNNFYSNALITVLTTLAANLTYRGSYILESGHSHLPLVGKGVHFANGIHGVQDLTITKQPFAHPDYSKLKADTRTVIVNANNVPFGSWDSATGTWVYSGALEFPASPTIIYYVEGNARIASVYVSGGSSSAIVTRGSLAIGLVGVLYPGISISGSANVAVGPTGAAASVVANVSVGSVQRLHLIAEKDLVVGRWDVLNVSIGSSTETNTLSVVANANAGLTLTTGLLNIASENDIFAWSDTSTAWVMASGLDAAATTRACVGAEGDATLAFRANIASRVLPYAPATF
jgi:hypothetical protein